MRRRVPKLQDLVLRHLAGSVLVLLIGLGSALSQSGDSRAQDQSGKPAPNATQPADVAGGAGPPNFIRCRRPGLASGHGVLAVVAVERPEVNYHHLAPQRLQGQRLRVDPLGQAPQFRGGAEVAQGKGWVGGGHSV